MLKRILCIFIKEKNDEEEKKKVKCTMSYFIKWQVFRYFEFPCNSKHFLFYFTF